MSGSAALIKATVLLCESRVKRGHNCDCGHHFADGALSPAGQLILAADKDPAFAGFRPDSGAPPASIPLTHTIPTAG
jgi:hypothetical protein